VPRDGIGRIRQTEGGTIASYAETGGFGFNRDALVFRAQFVEYHGPQYQGRNMKNTTILFFLLSLGRNPTIKPSNAA
jgi:hypothetical protein